MMKFNVLVVEDDEIDQLNVKRAFKKAGMTNPSYFASDGIEAIELLETLQSPLLILLDINMPRMNGLAFLKELRNKPKWELTPVVILTTSREETDRFSAYRLSVTGYILKPIEFSDFVHVVSTLGSYWTICEFPT